LAAGSRVIRADVRERAGSYGPVMPIPEQREVHALPGVEVWRELRTDPERGLDGDEAERRLAVEGPNHLPEQPPPGRMTIVFRQFRNAMTALLAGAAAVSLAVGEPVDAAVIAAIVLLNAALGAIQEGRAEAAASAVRGLLADSSTVVRDGQARELDSREIVRGDVILLSAGDRVPADGRRSTSPSSPGSRCRRRSARSHPTTRALRSPRARRWRTPARLWRAGESRSWRSRPGQIPNSRGSPSSRVGRPR
jgi:hypothetical protein